MNIWFIIWNTSSRISEKHGGKAPGNLQSNRYLIKQYEIAVSEYLQHLSSMQNVITINVAMSMGIIAAIATIISATKTNQWHTLLLILPIMGLITSIACIMTIHCGMKDAESYKEFLLTTEKTLGMQELHNRLPYKPLYITLAAFYLNTGFFVAAFVLALVKNEQIMNSIFAHKEIITSACVVLLLITVMVFASSKIYKWKYKK